MIAERTFAQLSAGLDQAWAGCRDQVSEMIEEDEFTTLLWRLLDCETEQQFEHWVKSHPMAIAIVLRLSKLALSDIVHQIFQGGDKSAEA